MYRRLDEAGMAVHPDTRRMMDALQRRDLAEIFSQIGNVFEQVLPPGSEIFAIRDSLLTLGAGTACMLSLIHISVPATPPICPPRS